MRASIAAGLNGACSIFDDPKIREGFAPDPIWENCGGFDRLIEEGQIVALRVQFFSKGREAKCCAVIATQTYESFVAKLKNEHVAAQLPANLRRPLVRLEKSGRASGPLAPASWPSLEACRIVAL